MTFDHLIGQEKIKKRLSHYIKVFDANQTCPFLLFVAAKGMGKTEFARSFAAKLKNKDGSKRSFIEENSSTIEGVKDFFNRFYVPYILDKEVIMFFDEAHELPQDLQTAFLTIFNTEKGETRNFRFQGNNFPFDFRKQTFLFATTESDKIFPPLKERLTSIHFEEYKQQELSNLFGKVCDDINFQPDILNRLGSLTRGNARDVVKLSKEVTNYCAMKKSSKFSFEHFEELIVDILGKNPLGVTETEKNILVALKKDGPCSLQELSAKTGISRTALQRDHEVYLLKKGLIKIETKRVITAEGQKILRGQY